MTGVCRVAIDHCYIHCCSIVTRVHSRWACVEHAINHCFIHSLISLNSVLPDATTLSSCQENAYRAVWLMSGVWRRYLRILISLAMSSPTAIVTPTPGPTSSTSWGMPARYSPTEASPGCNVPGDGRLDPSRLQCMQPFAKQNRRDGVSSTPRTLYARRRRVDLRAAGGVTGVPRGWGTIRCRALEISLIGDAGDPHG